MVAGGKHVCVCKVSVQCAATVLLSAQARYSRVCVLLLCAHQLGVWRYELLRHYCCGCVMAGSVPSGLTGAMSCLNARQGLGNSSMKKWWWHQPDQP